MDFVDKITDVAPEPWHRLVPQLEHPKKEMRIAYLSEYLRWRAEHELMHYPSRSWLSEVRWQLLECEC